MVTLSAGVGFFVCSDRQRNTPECESIFKGHFIDVCLQMACAASFLAPVSPELYARFASDEQLRWCWDKHCQKQLLVESYGPGRDICYLAFKRVATLYPRDVVTLRIKCRFHTTRRILGTKTREDDGDGMLYGGQTNAEDLLAFSSMSCSVYHPLVPEK